MKHRTGHIFKRANSNTYYLRYVINGKVIQQALYDDKGEAITTTKDTDRALPGNRRTGDQGTDGRHHRLLLRIEDPVAREWQQGVNV